MLLALAAILVFPSLCFSRFIDSGNTTFIHLKLAKRANLTAADGVVDPEVLQAYVADHKWKFSRGFANYEVNMGIKHPYDDRQTSVDKRDITLVPLDMTTRLPLVEIEVGTPPVKFTVIFDTASSDLMLPKELVTAKDVDKVFTVELGGVTVLTAEMFTDVVTLAKLTVPEQKIFAAFKSSAKDSPVRSTARLGMAFPELSIGGAMPFFHSLVERGQTKPVFAVDVRVEPGRSSERSPGLALGGPDPARFIGASGQGPTELHYIPLISSKGYWQLYMGDLEVSSGSKSKKIGNSLPAVIDTGTEAVFGPPDAVRDIYAGIHNSYQGEDKFWRIPCGAQVVIWFDFDDSSHGEIRKLFPMGPASLSLGRDKASTEDMCFGAFLEKAGAKSWALGQAFLKNFYSVFDVENRRVAFMLHSPIPDISPATPIPDGQSCKKQCAFMHSIARAACLARCIAGLP